MPFPDPMQPELLTVDAAQQLAAAREAIRVLRGDVEYWRHRALLVEQCFDTRSDAARLAWLEARLREHGPDLGYLLGLPQGWTSLRQGVDAARKLSTR